jgi:hypothetical protein
MNVSSLSYLWDNDPPRNQDRRAALRALSKYKITTLRGPHATDFISDLERVESFFNSCQIPLWLK